MSDAPPLGGIAKYLIMATSMGPLNSKLVTTIRKTLAKVELVITMDCRLGQLPNNVAIPNIAHGLAANVNQPGEESNFVWFLNPNSLVTSCLV